MTAERTQQMIPLHDLQTKLLRAENQFRKACDQIILMNVKLRDCNVRYRRAKRKNMKSFRYPLRLRLAVVEGVRNMYFDYATKKAEEVAQLRGTIEYLVNHLVTIDTRGDL